jgi:hypothetical protein
MAQLRAQIDKPPITESQRRRTGLEIAPVWGSSPPFVANFTEWVLSDVVDSLLEIPSIGLERKTYLPIHRRFFDPGVCSRSGYAVSG